MSKSVSQHRFNQAIVEQLARRAPRHSRRYTILHIAEVLNRSMSGNRNAELGSWRIPREDLYEAYGTVETITRYADGGKHPNHYWIEEDGYKITYTGTVFPGKSYGRELYNELDAQMKGIDLPALPSRALYELVARVAIILNAIHAFSDGNGRTLRGIASYLICRYQNRIIGNDEFIANKKSHDDKIIVALHALLPPKYNSRGNLDRMKASGVTEKKITIPSPWNGLAPELRQYLSDFRDEIEKFINKLPEEVTEDTRYASLDFQTRELALLYQQIARPREADEAHT